MAKLLFVICCFALVRVSSQAQAVVYDYKDILAQSTCTAMAPGKYVNAIRRRCSTSAPHCATICSSVGRKCFNSLHVYKGYTIFPSQTGKKELQMYKYNSCFVGSCGPNFCCCRS